MRIASTLKSLNSLTSTYDVGFPYSFTENAAWFELVFAGEQRKVKRFQQLVAGGPQSLPVASPLLKDIHPWKSMRDFMQKLPYPDCFHFSAAEGWLYLGDPVAAHEELDQIDPSLCLQRDVLLLRWHVYAQARKWDSALTIAEELVQSQPTDLRGWLCLCKALKSMRRRIEQAYDLASRKTREFPDNWELHYDAACYACLLGKREEAEFFLSMAMQLGGAQKVARLALKDSDLQAVWPAIKEVAQV